VSDNVLDYLREQFARVHQRFDRLTDDVSELKRRMTTLEIQVGNLAGTEGSHYAQVMLRLDRVDVRLDRIERRLDLTDAEIEPPLTGRTERSTRPARPNPRQGTGPCPRLTRPIPRTGY
jgi:tetrahydromethanopterin S-methyltransferase subunit G